MKKSILALLIVINLNCSSSKKNLKENIVVNYKVNNISSKTTTPKYDPSTLDFELVYDNETSLFQIVNKLNNDDNTLDNKITKIIYGGNFIYYKNKYEKIKLFNVDNGNDIYNVVTNFEEYNWKINPNETKEISGYKCYKATANTERKYNGEVQETFESFAWFTYEIPTSFGPRGLDGLPGLVLEGSFDGKIFFYATSITKSNINIKKPSSNKTISFDEFSNLMYDRSQDRKKVQQDIKVETKK